MNPTNEQPEEEKEFEGYCTTCGTETTDGSFYCSDECFDKAQDGFPAN